MYNLLLQAVCTSWTLKFFLQLYTCSFIAHTDVTYFPTEMVMLNEKLTEVADE